MTRVTYANYQTVLRDGARVVYDNHVGKVQKDPEWNGGYRVGGRSILALLDDCTVVAVVDDRSWLDILDNR